MRALARLMLVLALSAPTAEAQTIRPKPRPASSPDAAPALAAAPAAAADAALPGVAFAAAAPTIRPRPRPVLPAAPPGPFGAAMAATPLPLSAMAFPRPRPRPGGLAVAAAAVPAPAAAVPSRAFAAAPEVPRPRKRPSGLAAEVETVVPAVAVRPGPVPEATRPKKGAVCGDRAIRGAELPPITARTTGCGIDRPVRVTEVEGVRLSTPITVDCPTAKALATWVRKGLKPAVGRAGVAELRIAASYACRPRNNVRGSRISEHGRGKAVDISAVVLGDGRVLDVLTHYAGREGKPLRAAHKAACGIFGTTLGPGSDGYHENHLHFDTARHRSGPYCR